MEDELDRFRNSISEQSRFGKISSIILDGMIGAAQGSVPSLVATEAINVTSKTFFGDDFFTTTGLWVTVGVCAAGMAIRSIRIHN